MREGTACDPDGTSGWVDVLSNRGCSPKTDKKPRAHYGPRVQTVNSSQRCASTPTSFCSRINVSTASVGNHWLESVRWAGKRMLDEILRHNPPERDQFMGGSMFVDREAEKDKLIRKV